MSGRRVALVVALTLLAVSMVIAVLTTPRDVAPLGCSRHVVSCAVERGR